MNGNELYHHGIKGMRWGVRRYQNADGSLTPAGESRYKRGKRLSSELYEKSIKEHKKLRDEYRKEFDKYEEEARKIAKKYGLDEDDGGGGDYERYTEEQLRKAGERYYELLEKVEFLDDELFQRARKNAETFINNKYGDTAVSDIKYYNNSTIANGIGISMALLAAYAAVGFSMQKYKP